MNEIVDAEICEPAAGRPRGFKRRIARRVILAMLAIAILVALILAADRYLSFHELRMQRDRLEAFVAAHYVWGIVIYMAAYAVMVALSLPGALLMTMSGGFLFGIGWGSAAAVAGASTGAVIMYLAAFSHLGDMLRRRRRVGKLIHKLEEHARHDAFAYLLTLRLIPGIPFWLVNIAAGCVRMRLSIYWTATILGIAPSTVIYASVGAGLGRVFDEGGDAGVHLILQPQVLLPLIGLAVLALAPLAWGAWRFRGRSAAKPRA